MSGASRELIGLSYSPWTEKARWALEHHGLSFKYTEHLPMIGELSLRLKSRQLGGRATVPVLLTRHGPVVDSLKIAQHADRIGDKAPLFPEGKQGDIDAWNERSERALDAGRGLVVARTGASEAAKQEALPPFVPRALRPALSGIASAGVAFFRLKYGLDEAGEAQRRAIVADELRTVRAALGGKPYLLGDFTYADITMAVTLQMVKPPDGRYLRIKDGTREAWTDPELCGEFADLVAWRDELYAKHR